MQGEVQGLVTQARGMMSNLRSQFTGLRADKIFNDWESMQRGLDAAIQSLENAGTLLNRAGQEFHDVDLR